MILSCMLQTYTYTYIPCIGWSHTHKRYPRLLDSPAKVRDGLAFLARNAARSSGSEKNGRNQSLNETTMDMD